MKLFCGENEGQGVLADGQSHHNIGAHARMMRKLQMHGYLQFMRHVRCHIIFTATYV